MWQLIWQLLTRLIHRVCAFFQKDLSSSSSFFFHFYLQDLLVWSCDTAHLPFQSQLFCSSECNDVSYFFQLLVATFSQDVSFTKLNWKRKCFLRWQHTVRKLANSSLVLKCPWVSLRVWQLFDCLWASKPLTCQFILLFTSLDKTSDWVLLRRRKTVWIKILYYFNARQHRGVLCFASELKQLLPFILMRMTLTIQV